MKPIFWVLLAAVLAPFIMAAALFADVVPAPLTLDEWDEFMKAIKGSFGLGRLGLAAAVVQFFLFIWRDQFVALPGKWKVLIVQALTLLVGAGGLKISGFDWQSSLMHANTLGAFQVLVHQFIKQWTDSGEPRYKLPPK